MVRITVIIPTKNRNEDLHRCLSGLNDNDLHLLEEVIIVDDGSTPSLDLENIWPNLKINIIRNNISQGAANSRNTAGSLVKTDIIAFLDDDAVPIPNWLSIISRELSESRGAITGRVIGYDHGIVSKARQARYDNRYAQLIDGQKIPFFAGGNSAVWTKLFLKVGGFTQKGSGGDNGLATDLSYIGYNVHFIPDLIILHRNSKGLLRAIIEAYNSGLQQKHLKGVLEFIKLIVPIHSNAAGNNFLVCLFNWSLNVIHQFGRLQKTFKK
ncbi:glycosyltransferase family 2 protein [Bacillus cereus]|uniref:glycosyltransferase family 2 protein n=1 Tax=Bacillus cereus TaxID=1396 RepID=UPI0035575AEA|nr:glycosyltransferase [Bacillus cereus]